ncbi:hypothetical protein EDB87DRAFT_423806 [Lactarius vividus]|nr:hypothetical protein EDB87DRAFT_423806 [Lactarius vividus]
MLLSSYMLPFMFLFYLSISYRYLLYKNFYFLLNKRECSVTPFLSLLLSVIAPEVRPKRGHSKDNSHFFLPPSFGVEHLHLRTHLGPSPSLHIGCPSEAESFDSPSILLLFLSTFNLFNLFSVASGGQYHVNQSLLVHNTHSIPVHITLA